MRGGVGSKVIHRRRGHNWMRFPAAKSRDCVCVPPLPLDVISVGTSFGITKLYEWFTMRWLKPSPIRLSYAFQQSEIMVVPSRTQSLIIVISVQVPFLNMYEKRSFVSRQNPSNTHWPSITRPTFYFLFPNLLSSISTAFPGFLSVHYFSSTKR